MKRELDMVIISDTHLGTYACHARELLNYLNSIEVKTLILNGDFIDIWRFRKQYFPKEHMQVIQRILKMAANGTRVYYITGNHDDALRRYTDFSSGNIHLRDKLVLQLSGKSYWIFHGDIFDVFSKYSPFITKLGGRSYDYLILLNRFINKIRTFLGWPRMSYSKKVKNRIKRAVRFISDFENTAIRLAARHEYDYVVCGHIHRPHMKTHETSEGKKITYLNSGDWVENLTSLEYQWGRWSVYEYDEMDYNYVNPRLRVKDDTDEEDKGSGFSPDDIFKHIVQKIKE